MAKDYDIKPSPYSYQSLIKHASEQLSNHSDTAEIDAQVLMQHTVQQSLAWLITHADKHINNEHQAEFEALVEKRLKGLPVAYLTGHKEFWSLDLAVNEAVLIPRPDTETLVEQALLKLDNKQHYTVLDLGTGSGAIALSIAKERPQAQLVAVDNQVAALELAKQNAQRHHLHNVDFVHSNWLAGLDKQKFDLIVSNPPYVDPQDTHLQQGDLRFEPDSALVSKESGLRDLRLIIHHARHHLHDQGWLMLEHGINQANQVRSLLASNGYLNMATSKDINDLPRVTCGQWRS